MICTWPVVLLTFSMVVASMRVLSKALNGEQEPWAPAPSFNASIRVLEGNPPRVRYRPTHKPSRVIGSIASQSGCCSSFALLAFAFLPAVPSLAPPAG